MKKGFEYLLIFLGIFIICLNFISADAPTFIPVGGPANASLFYGNESLSVVFNATNATEFGWFAINDSRFLITQTGFITENQTAVLTNISPMAVGNYTIRVNATSALGENTSLIYRVQVNKSNYFDCGVYSNVTTITYPDAFATYTNCSSGYVLYLNVSSSTTIPISNYSNISAGAGYYNITVQRNDTQNYTNTFMSQFVTVNQATSVVNASVNNSRANLILQSGTSVWLNGSLVTGTTLFSSLDLLVDGNSQNSSSNVSSVSVYYTGFSALGFHNVTTTYTGNQNYSNSSETFNVTVIDTTIPTYSHNSTNNTEVGKITSFLINVTDNYALSPNGSYIFSTNNTGVWINDSAAFFTTTPFWVNVTKTLNSTVGTWVGYRWYFNDIVGNNASTPIYNVTTTADVTPPTYSGDTIDTIIAGSSNAFTITVTDIIALQPNGQYIFSTNNTGTWVNDSAVNFNTTSEVARSVKNLNSIVGTVVQYRWFFSDNSSNTASTPIYHLTIIGSSTAGRTGGSKTEPAPSPTIYNTDTQFSNIGDEYSLKSLDKINFAIGSASHSLTLNQFNSTAARVTIASSPISATLQKGVLYSYDISGDNVKDIRVRYDGLSETKAMIFIQGIAPVVAPPVEEEVTTPTENTNDNTNEETNSVPEETINDNSLKVRIIIVIVVVLVVILVIVLLTRQKQKNKRHYMYGY